MTDQLFIPLLLGTKRPKRESEKVAQFIYSILETYPEVKTELVDPLNYNFPLDGNDEAVRDPAYTDIVLRADGFLIVTPEYNHGYPSTLKRMLDSVSVLKYYKHKPVAFVGVSDGPWGGVRAIENLVPVVRELGLIASSVDAHFPKVPKLFDENGKLLPEYAEDFTRRVRKMIDELIWLTKTLKVGRDQEKK